MMLLILVCVCLTIAFFNAVLFTRNLRIYVPPPFPEDGEEPSVSVLIPARNEEGVIEAAVKSALNSRQVRVEVIVLNDHSEDRTEEIVRGISVCDSRVRLVSAPALPPGWCGKQFACSVLSGLATHELLCFMDSDVRLEADGLARMVQFLRRSNSGLVSGFPRQETETFLEKLLLPMMHFLLLSFLPMDSMRKYLAPSLGAGCGQMFVAHRAAYVKAGGHAAIRQSRHDGISLPKAFRRRKLKTDLCDATDVAACRMYRSGREVAAGLLKNANEGIAAPLRIFIFTGLLTAGHLLPGLLVLYCLWARQFGTPFVLSVAATALSFVPRLFIALRFRQTFREALLHPLAVLVFLGLQWYARYLDVAGAPAVWKGRSYQPDLSR